MPESVADILRNAVGPGGHRRGEQPRCGGILTRRALTGRILWCVVTLTGAGLGPRGFRQGGRGNHSILPNHIGEAWKLVNCEHQIEALQKFLAVLRQHTPRYEGQQVAAIFPLVPLMDLAVDLVDRFLPDGTRHHPQDIGVFLPLGALIAKLLQHGTDSFSIGLVHLAAQRDKMVFHQK